MSASRIKLPALLLPLGLAIILTAQYGIFCNAQYADEFNAAGQFLFYNGTVSGSLTYSERPGVPCSLKEHAKSYLYVGKYPPWDSNAFFFELYHLSTRDHDGKPDGEDQQSTASTPVLASTATSNIPTTAAMPVSKRQGFVDVSQDEISNFVFTTAAYVCFKDNSSCAASGSYFVNDPYYVPIELIDLARAKVERVNEALGLGQKPEQGYRVTGDETSWVSNNTVHNVVTIAGRCLPKALSWIWSASRPFKYNVTFSNGGATATFFVNTTGIALTLQFNGQRCLYCDNRVSNNYNVNGPNESGLDGNNTIALDTSNANVPKFTWANGSEIFFAQRPNSGGEWDASATDPAAANASASGRSKTGAAPRVAGAGWSAFWAVTTVGANLAMFSL